MHYVLRFPTALCPQISALRKLQKNVAINNTANITSNLPGILGNSEVIVTQNNKINFFKARVSILTVHLDRKHVRGCVSTIQQCSTCIIFVSNFQCPSTTFRSCIYFLDFSYDLPCLRKNKDTSSQTGAILGCSCCFTLQSHPYNDRLPLNIYGRPQVQTEDCFIVYSGVFDPKS